MSEATLAIVFKDDYSLKKWFSHHRLGFLLTMAKTPLGDRTYVSDNGDRTRVSFFRVVYEKDVYQMAGRIFDELIMLDTYSEQTVSWLESRGGRKETTSMKVIKRSKFRGQVWGATCNRCEAEFKCDRTEISDIIKTPTRYGQRDGEDYAHLTCTECSNSNITFKHLRTKVQTPEPPTDGEERP